MFDDTRHAESNAGFSAMHCAKEAITRSGCKEREASCHWHPFLFEEAMMRAKEAMLNSSAGVPLSTNKSWDLFFCFGYCVTCFLCPETEISQCVMTFHALRRLLWLRLHRQNCDSSYFLYRHNLQRHHRHHGHILVRVTGKRRGKVHSSNQLHETAPRELVPYVLRRHWRHCFFSAASCSPL